MLQKCGNKSNLIPYDPIGPAVCYYFLCHFDCLNHLLDTERPDNLFNLFMLMEEHLLCHCHKYFSSSDASIWSCLFFFFFSASFFWEITRLNILLATFIKLYSRICNIFFLIYGIFSSSYSAWKLSSVIVLNTSASSHHTFYLFWVYSTISLSLWTVLLGVKRLP